MAQESYYPLDLKHKDFEDHEDCQSWCRHLFYSAGLVNSIHLLEAAKANGVGLKLWNAGLKSSKDINKKEFLLKEMGLKPQEVELCQSILDICNGLNPQVLDNETHKRLSQQRVEAIEYQINQKQAEIDLLLKQLIKLQELNYNIQTRLF